MLNCPKCGASIKEGQKFCAKCGTKIEIEKIVQPEKPKDVIICPKCGTPNPITAKFCKKDGNLLRPEIKPKVTKEKEIVKPSKKFLWLILPIVILIIAGVGGYLFLYKKRSTRPVPSPVTTPKTLRIKKIEGLWATASSYCTKGLAAPYLPSNVLDGNTATAWVEEEGERCIGQWIKIYLPETKIISRIGICPGYEKIDPKLGDLFWLNNRLRIAELELSDGGIKELFFEDKKGIKYFEIQPPKKVEWIKLTIKDYYPGRRWDDMCISEIEIWGYEEEQ